MKINWRVLKYLFSKEQPWIITSDIVSPGDVAGQWSPTCKQFAAHPVFTKTIDQRFEVVCPGGGGGGGGVQEVILDE